MSSISVLVPASAKLLWATQPFALLFNKHAGSQIPVYVTVFGKQRIQLPHNFHQIVVAQRDEGASHWSTYFRTALELIDDDFPIVMLEDYWLWTKANVEGIESLATLIRSQRNILRIDLSYDRSHNNRAMDIGEYGEFDLVETPHGASYNFSLQASIWNKELLLRLLVDHMNPWRVELETRVPSTMRVLGTRQQPMRYANVFFKGQLDEEQLSMFDKEDMEVLSGYLNKETR